MNNHNNANHWLDIEIQQNHLYGYSIEEVEKRLSYGSYVGDNLNYVFVETPKAACSTMKWLLADLENRQIALQPWGIASRREMIIHTRKHGIKSLMQLTETERSRLFSDNNVVRFCVVRNPYARIVSAWADKIRQKEPKYKITWRQITAHHGTNPEICPTFSQFVRWVIETQHSELCNSHWRSMSYLLLPDLLNYTHILHTENLEKELELVLRVIAPQKNVRELLKKYRFNESLPIDWQACYDEETAALVAQRYQEDFDRYGYSLDSWKLKHQTLSLTDEVAALRNQLAKYENSALEAIRARNDVIFELIKKNLSARKAKVSDNNTILVLGDSHARIFKREDWLKLTPKLTWKTISVEGATLSGLKNPNSKTQEGEYFKQALLQHYAQIILLCLGEADTGFVIWFRAEKHGIDVQKAAQHAVDNYCQLIELAHRQAKVVVLSTPLPTLQDGLEDGEIAKARSSIKASQQQRTELTCWFNKAIESWCNDHGISYVNLDPLSKGSDGLVDPKLRHSNLRDHHYNSSHYRTLLEKHLLPVIRNLAWSDSISST